MNRERIKEVAEKMVAAENVRCACGSHGSWDHSLSGTSGDKSCVWAGCPNCTGRAVGIPILSVDLAYARRHKAELGLAKRAAEIRRAAESQDIGDGYHLSEPIRFGDIHLFRVLDRENSEVGTIRVKDHDLSSRFVCHV